MKEKITAKFKSLLKVTTMQEFTDWIDQGVIDFVVSIIFCMFIFSPVPVIFATFFDMRWSFTKDFYVIVLTGPIRVLSYLAGFFMLLFFFTKVKRAGEDYGVFNKRKHVYIIFGLLCIWMVVETCIVGWNYCAIWGSDWGYESIMFMVSYFVIYFFGACLVVSEKTRRFLLDCFMGMGLFMAPFSVLFMFLQPPEEMFMFEGMTLCGVFYNTNHYGYYLTMMIIMAAVFYINETDKRKKIFYFVNFAVNTAILEVNNTLGSFVGCVFGFIFMIIVYRIVDGRFNKKSFIMFLIFIAISTVMSLLTGMLSYSLSEFFADTGHIMANDEFAMDGGSGRWGIWMKTIEYIFKHPIIGNGVEASEVLMLGDYMGNLRPHNEYLQWAYFFGIPALILYVAGVFSIFLHDLKYKKSLDKVTLACIITSFAYLVSAFFGNTKYYTAPYFFMILGFAFLKVTKE